MNEAEPTTRLRLHVSTAVQGELFPAPPPIRFGGNKPLGFTKVRLSGFSYSHGFPRIPSVSRNNVGKMWAKIEPRLAAVTTKKPAPPAAVKLVELSAMPGGAELCGGYAARSRRCLMALTPMSAPARMPSALSVVTIAST